MRFGRESDLVKCGVDGHASLGNANRREVTKAHMHRETCSWNQAQPLHQIALMSNNLGKHMMGKHMSRTFTCQAKAWITPYSSVGPAELDAAINIGGLILCPSGQECIPDDWTFAGNAEITMTVIDGSTLIEGKAEALKAEIKKVEADAYVKVIALKDKLQQLLAITHEVTA